tara:strand:- start:123 stop:1364 length:1242 start_codon:yes stop_codon:yes gene_type:complete
MKIKKITNCRCCYSRNLKSFIDFGNMALTTEFPTKKKNSYKKIPMQLVICEKCKLFQLRHNYELTKLYNKNYGYKSGINASMKKHLNGITLDAQKKCNLKNQDIVLDIASNDGTLLNSYKKQKILKIGIDPVVKKFKKNYNRNMIAYSGFFSKKNFFKLSKNKKAKIITSIAVFYDIPDPNNFVSDIKEILSKDGIWIMEQSYFPFLVKNNAYDSICHEHLSYFMYRQLNLILSKHNLKVVDAKFNEMNGGSFRLFIGHSDFKRKINSKSISQLITYEKKIFTNFSQTKKMFKKNILVSKKKLVTLLKKFKKKKQICHIYGASTKGNVILQYCNLDKKLLPVAAERNPDKYGRYTPGTFIPIISEIESRKMSPDFYLVMPWHFKKEIISREKMYLKKGGKLIFPLPKIKIVSR